MLPCHAATLILGATGNGDFEAGTPGKIMFSTGNVTNWVSWTEQDTAANDTGVETIGSDRNAFIQGGGAFRSTISEVGTVGTSFTYGFDQEAPSNRGPATMVLLYQDLSNAWVEIAGSALRAGVAANGTVGTYSSSFAITAGNLWENRPITVGFRIANAGDGGATPAGLYPNIDNVNFSSVPEPSVALLGGLGVLGLLRRRRA